MHFAWFVESATQVTLLGRRDGTTCPKWVVPWLRELPHDFVLNVV